MRLRELLDLPSAARCVLLAFCVAAGPVFAASGAADPPCSGYALRGIAPGMRWTEVIARVGAGDAVESVAGRSGTRTSVTYSKGDPPVVVLFDRDASNDPGAQVILVRARGRASLADPVAFVRSLVPGLGEPALGGEHLENGFRRGATVWVDPGCGVEVTAYRKETEWWQPGQGDLFVQIESAGSSGAGSSGKGGASVPQPRAGATAGAQVGPPQELTVILEAAAPSGAASRSTKTPAAASPPDAAPPTPGASDEEASKPVLIEASYVRPRPPESAGGTRIPATVVLSVQVKRDGTVGEVGVVETSRAGMGFEQAAVDAVKGWRYLPATRGGTAEDAVITVRVTFD